VNARSIRRSTSRTDDDFVLLHANVYIVDDPPLSLVLTMPIFSTRGGNKGAHGRYLTDYRLLVDRLLATKPRDEAMLAAVGGHDAIGDLEFVLLDQFGFPDDGYLIDVGCGSGRLARRVAKLPSARYLGTDVNVRLLQYARETAGRIDFRYHEVDSTFIPEKDNVADMVVLFSVGTHMLNEEFYIYLADAQRVLKPNGRIIFSFLDFQTTQGCSVFESMVTTVRSGRTMPHLNAFVGRCDVPVWAKMLGMPIIEIIPGDIPFAESSERTRSVIGRSVAGEKLGQSVAVLKKL
jgi:SAM-dependent methyltransferase